MAAGVRWSCCEGAGAAGRAPRLGRGGRGPGLRMGGQQGAVANRSAGRIDWARTSPGRAPSSETPTTAFLAFRSEPPRPVPPRPRIPRDAPCSGANRPVPSARSPRARAVASGPARGDGTESRASELNRLGEVTLPSALVSSESGDNDSIYLRVALSAPRDNGTRTVSGLRSWHVASAQYVLIPISNTCSLTWADDLPLLSLTSLKKGGGNSCGDCKS